MQRVENLRDNHKRVRRRTNENDVCAKLNEVSKDQSLRSTNLAKDRVSEECGEDESSSISNEDQ
jgi:hypothetical protein